MPKIPHLSNSSSTPTLEQLLKVQDSSDETLKWYKYHKGKETPVSKLSAGSSPWKWLFRSPSSFFKGNRRVVVMFSLNRTGKCWLPWSLWFPSLKATGNKCVRVALCTLGFESQILLLMFYLKNIPVHPWIPGFSSAAHMW